MHFIGITGGAGSGKSRVLQYLQDKYDAYIIRADEVARELVRPGNICYEPYVDLFGREAVGEDGELKRDYIASRVFAEPELRLKMNSLIHPAVKEYLLKDVEKIRLSGRYEFYFLEAALLIEENYDRICDELWYIYTDDKVRRRRLKESRSYSDEKIDDLFGSQLSDEIFRERCKEIIDNSGDIKETMRQTDLIIERLQTLCKR